MPTDWERDLDVIWAALGGRPDREGEALRWLQRRSPGEWARLDEHERAAEYYTPARCSPTLHSTLAEGWRSFASDGRVREAAVRALASDPHEVANGFLLVRCDDWVDVVRALARGAVLDRLRSGALDVATWMPLILARDERRRAGQLVQACAAAFSPSLGERLLSHSDRGTRRWAVRRVLAQAPGAADLERLVAGVGDPTVARTLATRLAALTDDDGLLRLLRDRRAGVRLSAWEHVAEGRLPGLDLAAGLLDPAPTIRALVQRAARARGVDAGAVYLAAPQRTAPERRRRLVSLAEWGAPEATVLAEAARADPDAIVRVAAITVLARRLDNPGPVLLGMLLRVGGAELRAVRDGLLADRVRVDDADLAALRAGGPDQRLAAWRLGRARGRWERLVAALLARGDPDEALASAAETDLVNWCRDIGPEAGRPAAEQRRALEAALALAGPEHAGFVTFLLRT